MCPRRIPDRNFLYSGLRGTHGLAPDCSWPWMQYRETVHSELCGCAWLACSVSLWRSAAPSLSSKSRPRYRPCQTSHRTCHTNHNDTHSPEAAHGIIPSVETYDVSSGLLDGNLQCSAVWPIFGRGHTQAVSQLVQPVPCCSSHANPWLTQVRPAARASYQGRLTG